MKEAFRRPGLPVAVTIIAGLTAAFALAGCNSPMPPDSSAAASTSAARSAPSGESYGADKAIRTLALPPQKPLSPNPEYAHFPRYVGTLGGRQIEMKLGAKTDDASGVHGEYRFADSSSVILVAGDRDGETLEIEESNDGTHITGNWVGKFEADGSVSGERMDPDDSNAQPFELRPAVAGVMLPRLPAGNAAPAAPSLEPAPPALPPSPPNAVGGTSNVIIGE
ncbi:hypothetical protein P9239_10810 [Caballeronia sp. LZ062]|uniref:hypothetical protein n=1 Tax=unclassified Caballeronia TaxID=2646786 RepID=UPI002857FDB1|nr:MULTISPECIES: hypothetical protein [unclassified Caballeronia]MDR5854637.1 hypothetical protein [Caballeronia sp. LZ050]MDR5870835.1 hypothetical protein [Caballeronia sp. LZ062]